MRAYPKVPRHDHPVLSEVPIYETGTLYVTEKGDGSNFRFCLYDERLADWYPKTITNADPTDGDLVFGTKRAIHGHTQTRLDEIDGALHRAVGHLEQVDREAIRDMHEEFEAPLTFFAENMLLSSIDYGYIESPPPPLLGFDAYAPTADPTTEPEQMAPTARPQNPYEESFEGFLPHERLFDDGLLRGIGLRPVEVVRTIELGGNPFAPGSFEIPDSAYGPVQAEGVVLRNESIDPPRQAKLHSKAFEEVNDRLWGRNPDEVENGTERFAATYCTNGRIRKQLVKLLRTGDYESPRATINDLREEVQHDIWQEEWESIMRLNYEFNPAEAFDLMTKRCVEVATMVETNAALNDVPAHRIWETTL